MVDHDNLKERAYAFLRDAIVSGQLNDGSQSSVYRLAEQLGMSRTPVREAVLQLADAGLVTIERNRGIRIHGVTVKKIRDIFELRLLLEVPATFYAASNGSPMLTEDLRKANLAMAASLARGDHQGYQRQDRAFHDHIAQGTGNQQLCAAQESVRDVLGHPGSGVSFGGRDPQAVIDEHIAIADAIAAGDAQNSVLAMREHIVRTGTILQQEIAKRTGEALSPDWAERLFIPAWSDKQT